MNLTDRATSNAILATFNNLGIKPPKALADAFVRADKLSEKAEHLVARPGEFEEVVIAALLADRDPASDPEVQRVATAHNLMSNHGLADSIGGAATEAIRDACRTHRDRILTDWRKAFDQAATTLTTAHARIGDLPLSETGPILAKGGDIAAVWATATTAEQTIDQILSGWVGLMTLLRVSLDPRHRSLKLASLTLDQWRDLSPKLGAWDALCAGLDLSLPSLEEYRSRVARIQHELSQPETTIDTQRSAVAGREIRVPA